MKRQNLEKISTRSGDALRLLLGALTRSYDRARIDIWRAIHIRSSLTRVVVDCENHLTMARFEVWSVASLGHDRKRLEALKEIQVITCFYILYDCNFCSIKFVLVSITFD